MENIEEKLKAPPGPDCQDLVRLKEELTTFLCLKYEYSGIKLEEEINRLWSDKFKDGDSIKEILIFKPVPDEYATNEEDTNRPITVILPKGGIKPEKKAQFIKAAAYFPYQLDPECYCKFSFDENLMIQLAFATYHGWWRARHLMTRSGMFYPFLGDHAMVRVQNIPLKNENDMYFDLLLPEKYWGKSDVATKPIPFNPKTDAKETKAFWDYLYVIATTGERPEKITYIAE